MSTLAMGTSGWWKYKRLMFNQILNFLLLKKGRIISQFSPRKESLMGFPFLWAMGLKHEMACTQVGFL